MRGPDDTVYDEVGAGLEITRDWQPTPSTVAPDWEAWFAFAGLDEYYLRIEHSPALKAFVWICAGTKGRAKTLEDAKARAFRCAQLMAEIEALTEAE